MFKLYGKTASTMLALMAAPGFTHAACEYEVVGDSKNSQTIEIKITNDLSKTFNKPGYTVTFKNAEIAGAWGDFKVKNLKKGKFKGLHRQGKFRPGDVEFTYLNVNRTSGNTISKPKFTGALCKETPAPTPTDLDAYFASKPCGVEYSAIGDGGWPMCYRTEDGNAGCKTSAGAAAPTIMKGPNGKPLANVTQASGTDSSHVLVVDESGALYKGSIISENLSKIIDSNVISVSGGYKTACALIDQGVKKGVACADSAWGDPGLPSDFNAMQVSTAYGYACALNQKGEAWCWGASPNLFAASKPIKMDMNGPLINISAGQNSLCGTMLGGGSSCLYSQYDGRYLPQGVDSGSPTKLPSDFHPNAKLMISGYNRGVVVDSSGSATYYSSGNGTDLGLSNVVAGGGKRNAMSLMTANGDVYSVNGGNVKKIDGPKAEHPVCPL